MFLSSGLFMFIQHFHSIDEYLWRVNKKRLKVATQILVATLQNYPNQGLTNPLIGMVSVAYPWNPREPGTLDTARESLLCSNFSCIDNDSYHHPK